MGRAIGAAGRGENSFVFPLQHTQIRSPDLRGHSTLRFFCMPTACSKREVNDTMRSQCVHLNTDAFRDVTQRWRNRARPSAHVGATLEQFPDVICPYAATRSRG